MIDVNPVFQAPRKWLYMGRACPAEIWRLRQVVSQPDHPGPESSRPTHVAAFRVTVRRLAGPIDIAGSVIVRVSLGKGDQVRSHFLQGGGKGSRQAHKVIGHVASSSFPDLAQA